MARVSFARAIELATGTSAPAAGETGITADRQPSISVREANDLAIFVRRGDSATITAAQALIAANPNTAALRPVQAALQAVVTRGHPAVMEQNEAEVLSGAPVIVQAPISTGANVRFTLPSAVVGELDASMLQAFGLGRYVGITGQRNVAQTEAQADEYIWENEGRSLYLADVRNPNAPLRKIYSSEMTINNVRSVMVSGRQCLLIEASSGGRESSNEPGNRHVNGEVALIGIDGTPMRVWHRAEITNLTGNRLRLRQQDVAEGPIATRNITLQ